MRLQTHIAHFVEEKCSPVRSLKLTFFIRSGAGKRSFIVAEQFAFDQIFRNGSAVHLDESLVFAQALAVDRMSHEFLAGA